MDPLNEKIAAMKEKLIGKDPAKPAAQPTPTGPLTQEELNAKIRQMKEDPTRGNDKDVKSVKRAEPKQKERPKIVRRDLWGQPIDDKETL